MFFNTKHTTALCFVTCMAFSSSSIADIVISGTRVIYKSDQKSVNVRLENKGGNDSNLLIVFYVQIMPDDFVMQLHRF
ncbi:hypothetical protein ESCOMA044M4_14980 [Escherichia coli]